MKYPERSKHIAEMTADELTAYDAEVSAWGKQQNEKIQELRECETKAQKLLEEIFENGTFGLTPALYAEALRLHEEMNDRKEFENGRKLFVPAGTAFSAPRLCGFEVIVVDRPIAVGPSDFPSVQTFHVNRKQ